MITSLKLLAIVAVMIGIDLLINYNNNLSYADSETYRDATGADITQDQYEKRISICFDLKSENKIPDTTECDTWVLSEEGIMKIAGKLFSDAHS
jgi:hypothetical protein